MLRRFFILSLLFSFSNPPSYALKCPELTVNGIIDDILIDNRVGYEACDPYWYLLPGHQGYLVAEELRYDECSITKLNNEPELVKPEEGSEQLHCHYRIGTTDFSRTITLYTDLIYLQKKEADTYEAEENPISRRASPLISEEGNARATGFEQQRNRYHFSSPVALLGPLYWPHPTIFARIRMNMMMRTLTHPAHHPALRQNDRQEDGYSNAHE